MDPRLLKLYNQELQHVREVGAEFAKEFPKIAGRLGIEEFECADPYVERLLEGFSFLAARVQLKIEAEFPRFTQHLLEVVYPHYLSPTPSMAVVQLNPDLTEGALADGYVIPRHCSLRSQLAKGEQTVCEYRTSADLKLFPIELIEAEYVTNSGAWPDVKLPDSPNIRAAMRFKLRSAAGLTFAEIALDKLNMYIRGADELPMQIYEQIFANAAGIAIRPTSRSATWSDTLDASHIQTVGFENNEALLPFTKRSFEGYRLLHEYFVFPQRFMFFDIAGLEETIKKCTFTEIEIYILLNDRHEVLENNVSENNFALHCIPAINLFPRTADRIHLDQRRHEYHIVPDRTRPMDFEVYSITEVVGYGGEKSDEQEFLPLYGANDLPKYADHSAFFAQRREPRLLSSKQLRRGPRSSFIGSEVFLSLVDANEGELSTSMRQVAIKTYCTNRDLPLHMSLGKGKTDFSLEIGAPVDSIRVQSGPSKPKPSHAEGETAWRLISHLSLNYLSLVDNETGGATALRELLMLYGELSDPATRKQIDGVMSVTSELVTRRIKIPGPITFGRGLEITLTLDDGAFQGSGIFLLGAVMENFFSKYTSINSFTEMVLRSAERGEIKRWPVRTGRRHIL